MASMFLLRAHIRLKQEGFEQKPVQSIPGCIHPILRTISIKSGSAQTDKKSFQCLEDEDCDTLCSVAQGKAAQCAIQDSPSDCNDTDPKDGSPGGSKEEESDHGCQSDAACTSSLVSSGSDGQDDGDDDEDKRDTRKRREPEDAPSWWSPDERKLFLLLRSLLLSRTDAAAVSLAQLLKQLLQGRQLVDQPARRRELRRLVIWAVRSVFGQQCLGQYSSTAASCMRGNTLLLNRSRPPELSARPRFMARGRDSGCVVVDLPPGQRAPQSTRASFHCVLGPSSGAEDSDDTPGPQVPSGDETTVTYGELQDLEAPVQCTENNQTEATPRNEGGTGGFQPLPPTTLTFQLTLRKQIKLCTHPCEEQSRGDGDTIDMRQPVPVPEDAIGMQINAVASASAGASAPWLAQLEHHLNRAAHDVHGSGRGLRRPMQASEVCDKCFQREVWEVLNPCGHKVCHVCSDDMYPPTSLQAVANPVRRCPVCRREVKHIEDRNLYPP